MKTLLVCLLLASGLAARAAHHTDIEYGQAGGESLKLDAFVPEGAGPFPAVILVHGGGWTGGDKSGGPRKGYMAPMHEPLEKAGFAWFSINYRLAPKHRYPAPLEDVETAIRWVKAHAKEYRLDPQRIALSGESAGGHLAVLAVVRAEQDTRVAAMVPFYGRVELADDLKAGDELRAPLMALFDRKTFDDSTRALLREASPIHFVKAGLPPFLFVHGTADASVPYQQSVEMQAKLRAAGVPADLITIKEGIHGMLSWDAVAPDYKRQVVAWLQKTLKLPAAGPAR
jgi:alpha-L-fucosidase 2